MRYNRIKVLTATAAAALAGIAVTPAQAQLPAVSNLANTSGNNRILNTPTLWGSSFTTGAEAQTFQSLTVPLERQLGGSGDDLVTAYLYSDALGLPDLVIPNGVLGPITVPTGATTESLYTFTPLSTVTFAASTKYWVVLSSPGDANQASIWSGTDNLSETGLPGWGIGTGQFSNSGSGWVDQGLPTAFKFEVAVVPEPGTYALMAGLGLVGFAGYRRWRNHA